jgi:hypothetical protein
MNKLRRCTFTSPDKFGKEIITAEVAEGSNQIITFSSMTSASSAVKFLLTANRKLL